MRWVLIAVVVAGCGGSNQLFKGDEVAASLTNGQPSCSEGETGPTLTTRTATGSNNGQPYESTIVQCDWTCGNLNGIEKAHVFVIFYTDASGAWVMDPHADRSTASCP